MALTSGGRYPAFAQSWNFVAPASAASVWMVAPGLLYIQSTRSCLSPCWLMSDWRMKVPTPSCMPVWMGSTPASFAFARSASSSSMVAGISVMPTWSASSWFM